MKGYKQRVLCPVCKLERWTEVSDVLFFRHIIQIGLISFGLMSLAYSMMEYRVIIIPPLVWIGFEFARHVMNRQRMVCPQCHFDPFLYKFDVKKARQKCERQLTSLAEKMGRQIAVKKPEVVPNPVETKTAPASEAQPQLPPKTAVQPAVSPKVQVKRVEPPRPPEIPAA